MMRTTVTIPRELYLDAKAMDVNISRHVQQTLRYELARRKAERWATDNKAAIDAYNERIRTEGPALAGQMTW